MSASVCVEGAAALTVYRWGRILGGDCPGAPRGSGECPGRGNIPAVVDAASRRGSVSMNGWLARRRVALIGVLAAVALWVARGVAQASPPPDGAPPVCAV